MFKKKLIFILICFILLFNIIVISNNIPITYASPDWYNDNWDYRRSIGIYNASGAGINYQLKLNVHYGGGSDSGENIYLNNHSQIDFEDIRFTDDDGTTLLNHWNQTYYNSDNATYWIKINDNLSATNQTIYIYYGNNETSTVSNGTNTFIFFDNFLSDTLNTDKWEGNTGDASISNSILTLTTSGGAHNFNTKTDFSSSKRAIAYQKNNVDEGNNDCNYVVGFHTPTTLADRCSLFGNVGSGIATSSLMVYKSGGSICAPSSNIEDNVWHIKKWICDIDTHEARFYENSVELTGSPITTANCIPTNNLPYAFYYANTAYLYTDWIAITKYVKPEPSWGDFGEEESPEEFYLTTIFFSGISSIYLNDTLKSNNTKTSFNMSDTFNITSIPLNGYTQIWHNNNNESLSWDNPYYNTITENITIYSIAYGYSSYIIKGDTILIQETNYFSLFIITVLILIIFLGIIIYRRKS